MHHARVSNIGMKGTGYEKLLFVISLAGWSICCLLLLFAATVGFPLYSGLLHMRSLQFSAEALLRGIRLPLPIFALSMILMNCIVQKLSVKSIAATALSCMPVPLSLYFYTFADITLAPNLTAGVCFFAVPFLLRTVYGDILIFKKRSVTKVCRVVFLLLTVIASLLAVCLCVAACSKHVLAQTVSFLALSLPFSFLLQMILMADTAAKICTKAVRLLIDILSAVLPFYAILRCFYPDGANTAASVSLFAVLTVLAAEGVLPRIFAKDKQKNPKM